MSESDSDRLLVSKQNLARCAWCGTPESPKWVTNQKGVIFCSSECQNAKKANFNMNYGFASALCGLLWILAPILWMIWHSFPITPSPVYWEWMIYALLLFVSGLGFMVAGYEGKKFRDRKDKYRDVTLLQCEYCNQANPPSVVRCQYCGASLTKAPFRYETTPPWIQKEMYLWRFKCPLCKSAYSYNVSNIENDGLIKCQNCGKLFASPSRTLQREYAIESSLYTDV